MKRFRLILLALVAALWFLDPAAARAVTFGGNSYAGVTLSNNLQLQTISGTAVPGATWNAGQGGTTCNAAFASVGAGAGQFSELYQGIRTLSPSANETINLYGGLTDPFGNAIDFARVKSITFELFNQSQGAAASASAIVWEGGASDPWVGPLGGTTPSNQILSGGASAHFSPSATGWVVTNGSVENIKVVNSDASNAATYRLTIVGSTT